MADLTCKKCKRSFPSEQSLRMHTLRKHGKMKGSTRNGKKAPRNSSKRPLPMEEVADALRDWRDSLTRTIDMLDALTRSK